MILPLQAPAQGFALPILQSPLGLPHVLTVAAALFALGLFAALAHRNLLRILMGLELMLLAVMLNLVAFTSYLQPEGLHGHAITLLLVLLALAQLAVGMALVAMLLRHAPAPLAQAAAGAKASEAAATEPGAVAEAPERDPLDVERYDDLKW